MCNKASYDTIVKVSQANTKENRSGPKWTVTAYHIQGTNASTMLCLYQSTEKELCMEN